MARFDLLASALAGRTVQVASGIPGEPSWSDGSVIFVDPHASVGDQLEAVAVQASLLAAGSLQPEIVRWLTRRTALARRYLAIEGHRALTEIEDLLPLRARSLIDRDIAGRTDSPPHPWPLRAAAKRSPTPLRCLGRSAREISWHQKRLRALEASTIDSGDRTTPWPSCTTTKRATVSMSSQAPWAVAVRWDDCSKKCSVSCAGSARAANRDGYADAPEALQPARRASAVVSNRIAPAVDGVVDEAGGTKYPEWDVYRRRYRPDWCTVHEVDPPPTGSALADMWGGYDVRRPLARLGLGLGRYHRQAQGDDIDIDAAVEKRVELMAGSAPDEAVYLDSLRRRRDLAVLLLLDVSGSAAEPGAIGQTVHTQQRAAAAALACALHDLGDRVALYAFHSQGRSAVELMPVKRFDDDLDVFVMRRLSGLIPGAYSRLGAAIRHGTAVLERRAAPRIGCWSCCPTAWPTTTAMNAFTAPPTPGTPLPRRVGEASDACV
ncbi:von Willebrand factor type A domain protein [Mycobacterium xenopi 4042]|uniref:von Willebrand factor type A domain protein n=1 Tax=Mycobacterium xenopi 4042 TaxID=1299334 RepID=X7Z4W1_MYCXE|nr:von Willebrand factor type A domain protein [Mycobacterium xenopi 4042]